MVDQTDPHDLMLAEVLGKFVDLGERKSEGDEVRAGIQDLKKNPGKEQMKALCDLQQKGVGDIKFSELDSIAGQAQSLGMVTDMETGSAPLVPGVGSGAAEALQGALQQHKDNAVVVEDANTEEPPSKKLKKAFNLPTKLAAARDKHSNSMDEVTKKVAETCRQVREMIAEVDKVSAFSTAKNALPLAEKRLECAESWAILGDGHVFNNLLAKYKGKDEGEHPFTTFMKLQSLQNCEQAVAELGAAILPGENSEVQLKVAEENFMTDVMQPIKDMIKSLCDVKGQLTQAANRGQKKREKAAAEALAAQKKLDQQQQAVPPIALAQAVVSGRSTRAAPDSMSVWHFDLAQIGHPKVPTYQNINDAEKGHASGSFGTLPFMVRSNCIKEARVTDVGLQSQISVFKNNFRSSAQAKDKGRAGTALRGVSESLVAQATKEVCPFIDNAAPVDTGLKGLQLWGFVSNYRCTGRTEPQFFGCSRIVLEGRRLLWCVSIQHAVTAKRNLDPNGADDMDALVAFIFGLNAPRLKWMLQHNLHVYHKMQHAGTALWVPAAHLIFERIMSK